MLGIDRRALEAAWTVFLFALIAFLVYEVRHTLVIFALALFLAHLLSPIVNFLERTGHRRVPRTVVLVGVYAAMLALTVIAVILVGGRIGEEAASLATRLPAAMREQDPLGNLFPSWLVFAKPRLYAFLQDRVGGFEKDVFPVLSSAGMQIISGLGNILSAVLIPILSFFFLKDGATIRQTIVESFAHRHQTVVNEIMVDLHELLAQYIRALVLLALAAFVFYTGFLSMTSVPYAILLAGIAAAFEFIPVVGPLTASAIIILVAAFTGYPHILWIILFLVIYRIFQDYVLSPYLMSSGVEIDPLLVLFGVLAGEQIAGVPGMFFSVPTMAALRVFYVRLRRQRRAQT